MSSPVQLDLFADSEPAPRPAPNYLPDPDKVRVKLLDVLDELRAAQSFPWDARRKQYWRTVFPQMTNWLPGEEAARLRAEFAAEMRRWEEP